MALEISEIGVRMAVADDEAPSAAPAPEPDGPSMPTPQQRENIVAACVRNVLAALRSIAAR